MHFEKGNIYHIYNQGNNRRQVFFSRENYLFFLRKVRTYFLPYADILAWCLMPNHFHFMVMVKEVEIELKAEENHTMTQSQKKAKENHTMTLSHRMIRTFNQSIAIMLRSYTRAINKQENTSGSLFRPHTKAECVTCPEPDLSPSFITRNGVTEIPLPEYPEICFRYIHQNPVKAGLVKTAEDWEFSSASDYSGHRNGTLVNKNIAKKLDLTDGI